MAFTEIRLPRLDTHSGLVDQRGVASMTFAQWWNAVATAIENAINGVIAALAAADTAQGTADQGLSNAAAAQATADTALGLAQTAVQQDVGPAWQPATGTEDRTALATVSVVGPFSVSNPPTQAEVQAIGNALVTVSNNQVAISRHFAAMTNDLIGNGALTG